jgi:hypothetical protein
MRKVLIAATLLAGVNSAFAQVSPPDRILQCDVNIDYQSHMKNNQGHWVSDDIRKFDTDHPTIEFVDDHKVIYKSEKTKPVVYAVTAGETAYVFEDITKEIPAYVLGNFPETSFSMSIDRSNGKLEGRAQFGPDTESGKPFVLTTTDNWYEVDFYNGTCRSAKEEAKWLTSWLTSAHTPPHTPTPNNASPAAKARRKLDAEP